jgi:hypothetical protein
MKKLTVAATLFLTLSSLCCAAPAAQEKPAAPGNVVLVGWDGSRRERVQELLAAGQLPNLQKLISEGCLVLTEITTGETQTKPGWAEILTGYSAPRLKISGNRDYRPIPVGYTVFERLQKAFGPAGITTIFLSGKINNLGARGPHEICRNCISRDAVTREKTQWWAKQTVTTNKTRDGKPPVWVARTGEPYFNTSKHVGLYTSGLGAADNVGALALANLEKHAKEPFFAFFHFEEPDEQGHLYGESSKEYADGLKTADRWLGEIVKKLGELGIYKNTTIYVTTDHGFQAGGFEHLNAPKTFLATNSRHTLKKTGDRKDITPTILEEYGVGLKGITPPLDGSSLFAK